MKVIYLPHHLNQTLVSHQIFGYLDDQDLAKSRVVCKSWRGFIDNCKFTWLRIIKKYLGQNEELAILWNEILGKATLETVRELAFSVRQFKIFISRNKQSPLHFAVRNGKMDVILNIYEHSVDKWI